MWRYSWISSLLVCLALSAFAQKEKAPDSTRGFQRPTGIRLGTDLISLGKTIANSSFSGWEGNADVDFGRYYAALDYGLWKRDLPITNGTYQNDGRYLRVGVDINFLLNDPDKNMFFIGFRYARSNFNERVEYQTNAIEFGDFQMESSNLGAKAGWAELTSGLRVKIWKQFWLGFTGRMKFLPHGNVNLSFETYEIPGYGQTFKDIYWGFNYQAFWRIPLKSEK